MGNGRERLKMENKRKYKIVASDLDGTLLSKEQIVSEENFHAIAQMKRLGVEFVPTTGRGMNEIDLSLINFPDIRYIITSNGAVVFDKKLGKQIITRYISIDTMRLIIETISPYNVFIVVHDGGKTYYDKNKYNPEFLNICGVGEYYGYIIGKYAEAVEDFESFLLSSNEVESMSLFFELDEGLRSCKQIFDDCGRLCAASPSTNYLEVYSSDAGKGKALAAFADKLGVDIADVIAVGDSDNDSTMIEQAGVGLAVANACDALKEIADQTICDQSEHIAKYVLENFII